MRQRNMSEHSINYGSESGVNSGRSVNSDRAVNSERNENLGRTTTSGKNVNSGRSAAHAFSGKFKPAFVRLALFALLFALIFTMTLATLSTSHLDFALAAKSRSATQRDASSIAATGTNFAAEFNSNHDTTHANYFGIDAEVDATGSFKWGSRGWGFDDVDLDGSDNAIAYWIEWKFSGTALAAIQQNRASYYIKATSTYEGDLFEANDETAIAFQWVGVQSTAPKASQVSTDRSGNSASWASTVTNSTFAHKSDWGNGTANAEWGTISSGAYQSASPVPAGATGARLICYVITDHNIKGGLHDLSFTLYEKPADSVASSDYKFDLDGTLYGEKYTIQIPNGKTNWHLNTSAYNPSGNGDWDANKPYMYFVEEGASSYHSEYTATDATLSNSNDKTDLRDDGDYLHTWSHKPDSKNASGVLVSHGRDVCEFYFAMTFEVTLPAYVTEVEVTGNLFTAGYNKQEMDKNDKSYINAQAQLYNGSQTPDTSKKAMFTATPLDKNAGDECQTTITYSNTNKASGYESSCTKKAFTLNSGTLTASSSERVFTVALYVHFRKEEIDTSFTGWGDYGQYYAMMGDVKVSYKGKYWVKYDSNGGTGSMGIKDHNSVANTQEFVYGTAEDMKANGFSRTGYTFVGWALDTISSVKYKNKHNTGNGEVTQLSGGKEITLYAVWRESDFGVLPGKTRDTTWGSESNPFVISELEHWHNLVDIVNKARDPVDSVKGTYYDNEVTNSSVSHTSFYKGYFAVTADLELGNITPIGDELDSISYSARNFKGHIYGADESNNKVMRKISVDIDSDKDSVGLFGVLCGNTGFDTTIEYLEVTGTIKTTGKYAGGFVGSAFSTYSKTIKNCKSSVNVIAASFNTANQATGKDGVAGFVGSTVQYNTSSTNSLTDCNLVIENCEYVGGTKFTQKDTDGNTSVDANIFGNNGVGGIIGYVTSGSNKITVSNCKVSGTIQGYQNVGGIGGRVETTNTTADSIVFKNLYNSANISVGNHTAGGIVGYLFGNSTGTGNVATVQYAYNCGSVKGETASKNYIGGIVGEARKDTAGSVTLKNCYNVGSLSNFTSSNAGAICGKTSFTTITDCWQLNNSSGETTTNHALSGSNNTGVKVFSAYNGTKILPAVNEATDLETGWETIVEKDITAFGIFGTATDLDDGKFLSIFLAASANGTTGTRVAPANLETSIDSSINKHYLNVKDLIFNASTSTRLSVLLKAITLANKTQTKTYGEKQPDDSLWISTSSNTYTQSAEVFYDNNNEWSANAPVNANTTGYAVRVALYNNNIMVGAQYLAKAYIINKRELSFTPTWSDSPFIYNGSHQGLVGLTVNDLQYDELAKDIVNIEVTGTGLTSNIDANKDNSYTFAGAVNCGNYTVDVKLKNENGNYSLPSVSKYTWSIAQRPITVNKTWTTGYRGSGTSASPYNYTYNSDHQGIEAITISNVVESETPVKIAFAKSGDLAKNIQGTLGNVGNGTYKYSNIDTVGEYTITLSIDSNNYKWADSTTNTSNGNVEYKWKINQKAIGNDIVFGYAFDEAEKFMNPGEMLDSSGKVVLSGGTYYTLNSSFAHI